MSKVLKRLKNLKKTPANKYAVKTLKKNNLKDINDVIDNLGIMENSLDNPKKKSNIIKMSKEIKKLEKMVSNIKNDDIIANSKGLNLPKKAKRKYTPKLATILEKKKSRKSKLTGNIKGKLKGLFGLTLGVSSSILLMKTFLPVFIIILLNIVFFYLVGVDAETTAYENEIHHIAEKIHRSIPQFIPQLPIIDYIKNLNKASVKNSISKRLHGNENPKFIAVMLVAVPLLILGLTYIYNKAEVSSHFKLILLETFVICFLILLYQAIFFMNILTKFTYLTGEEIIWSIFKNKV